MKDKPETITVDQLTLDDERVIKLALTISADVVHFVENYSGERDPSVIDDIVHAANCLVQALLLQMDKDQTPDVTIEIDSLLDHMNIYYLPEAIEALEASSFISHTDLVDNQYVIMTATDPLLAALYVLTKQPDASFRRIRQCYSDAWCAAFKMRKAKKTGGAV